jgi:methylenetetrahydromethanopterin dehydrogenase
MAFDLQWLVKNESKEKKPPVKKMNKKNSQEKTEPIKVGILKIGNLASSVLLEMLLDERADRENIDVRTISSGAKMVKETIQESVTIFKKLACNLRIIISPNISLKRPFEAVQELAALSQPLIIITDVIKKETIQELEKLGIGYLIVQSDAMIGARREFLDPVEMAIYNADLIKVLAIGGVFSILYREIDAIIDQLAENGEVILPKITITPQMAVDNLNFSNPYAAAKAQAALEIAKQAATINTIGCFKIHERKQYIQQVTTGHEMIRNAVILMDEAREMEKSNNKVLRQPHGYEGEIQEKRLLNEKPQTKYQ